MNNQVALPYAPGAAAPTKREERAAAVRRRRIHAEAIDNDTMIRAVFAFGADLREGAAALDDKRMALAAGRPDLNALLASTMLNTVRQAQVIQSMLFEGLE